MKVLVINCGSSSLKFQLIDMTNEDVIAKGNVERIGEQGPFMKYQPANGEKVTIETEIPDHTAAFKMVVDALLDSKNGVIKSIDEISAVGHRVVHGGEYFSGSVVIDDKVIKAIEDCIDIAPLHNPANLMGIAACKNLMPNTPMVGVFDTAFHQTMPKHAYIYPIPYEYYEKYKVRKYGFHGVSHKYVSHRAAEILGIDINNSKIVTCHLGNGASVCAVNNGKSVDTSMGFTPLEGLAMGTRSGNIDPAVVTYLMNKENLSTNDANNMLNKKSGMIGITGFSNDFRDIETEAEKGNERAQLAIDVFAHKVKQYILSYAAIMGGIDALVFTAGIGEWGAVERAKILEGLDFAGISVDFEKNSIVGQEIEISKQGAKVRTLVVPTNEEMMIARDTASLIQK